MSTTRWPFKVTIYDADARPHCVTVWLEIEPSARLGWDAVEDDIRAAREDVAANLECEIDVETLMKSTDGREARTER